MKAPRPTKVKMPSIEPFDKTMGANDSLNVYKAQMYLQDMDDATCCCYLSTT